MDQNQQYIEVIKLIGLFQGLETSLKFYIGANYHYISEKVGKEIVFKYSFDDLDNASLERLLTIFAKFNDNSELQKRLKVLKEWRNLVAHKSLLLTSMSMPKELKAYALGYEDNPINFLELNQELLECIQLLVSEMQSLNGLLTKPP
ncbi:MAG: hypothetical protein WBL28_01165 [Methylotenera sp.]